MKVDTGLFSLEPIQRDPADRQSRIEAIVYHVSPVRGMTC